MIKVCNIEAKFPIYGIKAVPLHGTVNSIKMGLGEISHCIYRGGIVDQVLSDGQIIRLDLSNYKKDFEALLVTKETNNAPTQPVPKQDQKPENNQESNNQEEQKPENNQEPNKQEEQKKEEVPPVVNNEQVPTEEQKEQNTENNQEVTDETANVTTEEKTSETITTNVSMSVDPANQSNKKRKNK